MRVWINNAFTIALVLVANFLDAFADLLDPRGGA